MSLTLKDIEKLLDEKLTPIQKTLDSIDSRLSKIEKWIPVQNTDAVREIKRTPSKSSSARV